MCAINNIKRQIAKAKRERNLRRELHGVDSSSYQAKADQVRRLEHDLVEAKYETARSHGLNVIGGAA